jgi:hypothetical protein
MMVSQAAAGFSHTTEKTGGIDRFGLRPAGEPLRECPYPLKDRTKSSNIVRLAPLRAQPHQEMESSETLLNVAENFRELRIIY